MKLVNIHDAKTHLSQYLREIKMGRSIILCERNKPVAELRPLNRSKPFKQRKLGCLKGSVLFMSKNFNDPLNKKELDLFYNSSL